MYILEAYSVEGKYWHKEKYSYLGTTDTWYFIRPGRYLLYYMVKMNDFNILWCSTTTRFDNKTRSPCTKRTERKLDSFTCFLLWSSIVNDPVLWLNAYLPTLKPGTNGRKIFKHRDIPEFPINRQIFAKIGTHGQITHFFTLFFWRGGGQNRDRPY